MTQSEGRRAKEERLKTAMAFQRFLPLLNLWRRRQRRSYVLSKIVAEVSARATVVEKFAFLGVLAHDLDIQTCTVNGDFGLFEGPVDDTAALGLYLRTGTYNAGYQTLLSKSVFPNGVGTYIDVGSNVGFTVIPLARACPAVQCYAFEPEPRNFFCLWKNIASHGVEKNVRARAVAAFSREDTLNFELARGHSGDHRVRTSDGKQPALDDEESREVIQVKAAPLDSFFAIPNLARPIMVKMDTQGSEVQIMRGAERLLGSADFLYSEFAPYWIRRVGDAPEEYVERLQRLGFRSGWVEEDDQADNPAGRPIEKVLSELRAFNSRAGGMEYTNVFVSRAAP
jgi:FkbM family methyltransferase